MSNAEKKIIDRLGSLNGNYMWNDTDSFPMRSLPPWIRLYPYVKLARTDVPLPEGMNVRSGLAAPAFEQPGGATIYLFQKPMFEGGRKVGDEFVSVQELLTKGLVEIVE
ncbi:TNT domain-containing protein [Corynebacterium lowii]|uniref:TNT domain-containing protein n=1 Tax=Corynebacterium lowii TaxID=1544413 RepID=UPI0006DC3C4B|nr:TNT domain-containing protein [Corynebacterium lowii]MDP9851379.1 hypothetical protein [Corynebacterium lowii]